MVTHHERFNLIFLFFDNRNEKVDVFCKIFRQCVSHKKGNVSQCLLFLFQRIVSEQNIRIEKSNVLVHFIIVQSREFTVFRIFLLFLKVKAILSNPSEKNSPFERGKMFRWQKQQDLTNRSCSCKYDWRKASDVCHWKVAKTSFNHIKSLPLPLWRSEKSWMNCELFEEWVREQDEKFKNDDRKVAPGICT